MNAQCLRPVLLIEDSPDDAEFTRRAFARCQVAHPVVIAEDPQQALAMLSGTDEERLPLPPALVMLDLNLPGCGGKQLLNRIKSNVMLHNIPLVVFSTSSQQADVEQCYRAGANSYHAKPTRLRDFEATIERIANYWLSAVVSPPIC